MSFPLKLIGAVCVVLCTTGIGFMLSEKLRRRTVFLNEFDCFLSALDTNIRYSGDEIVSLIKTCAPGIIKSYMDFNQKDYYSLWQSFLRAVSKSSGLREEDYKLLCDFGEKLGATDVEGQLSHIRLYREMLGRNYNNSLLEYKSKSKIYKLLGFFVGAAALIMIL